MMRQVDEIRDIIAPGGRLRAAINLGNPVLAQRHAETGELGGVSVALARQFARQLGCEVEFVLFDAAGETVAAGNEGRWDVAFLAVDPVRAANLLFTAPYVRIEGVFVTGTSNAWRDMSDLDQPGRRICVGRNAAYDLFLSRALRHTELVRVETSAEALSRYLTDGLDAAAGIRQAAEAFVALNAGCRIVGKPFMEINQAVAIPREHAAALPRLGEMLAKLTASGVVGDALAVSGHSRDLAI